MIATWQAMVLGIVEGLTEFVPVSSTGHLILVAHWMGLHGQAVKTFEVVIQGGALVAVLWFYWGRLASMGRAVITRDPTGTRLLRNLLISCLPILVVGQVFHNLIKGWLFGTWPVVAALAVGGAFMIVLDRRWRARNRPARGMGSLTGRNALLIGLAQCLALWPGTSRSMVTILAGMGIGLPAAMAAEYSFLLALPSLGAAVVFDAFHGGFALVQQAGWPAVLSGFVAAILVAFLTIGALLRYLRTHGLAVFGWYRLALAAAMAWLLFR